MNAYDLTQLDTNSFESMVNSLAMNVLGNGLTGFSPGADGGRDGYFKGEAPYPSITERWSGIWFIQSKFHAANLSTNQQGWLVKQVKQEIEAFQTGDREIPDNWIIATNIDLSGKSKSGSYDKIVALVKSALGSDVNVSIWGGSKIVSFLTQYQWVADSYGHFLTPGNVLSELYSFVKEKKEKAEVVIQNLVVSQFSEQVYTKLEHAGSSTDTRPKIHQLFVDLPFRLKGQNDNGHVLENLLKSSARIHKLSFYSKLEELWGEQQQRPSSARVLLVKGGPGQGKSTLGQYFAQLQRASIILEDNGPSVLPAVKMIARELKKAALEKGLWIKVPRIPVTIELKDFASWMVTKSPHEQSGVFTYIASRISQKAEQSIDSGLIKECFKSRTWFVNFDGLDEVPNDVKDAVAEQITSFVNNQLPLLDADVLVLCSTRPQGYSGQFNRLEATTINLSQLSKGKAVECATPILKFDRSEEEWSASIKVLDEAMGSQQVRELMITPLQSHIMALVIRDGGRPPEKRWELFDNFYRIMKKRESLKNFQDPKIARLLREDVLLKAIHSRLGVALHARSEHSAGADTVLQREEFRALTKAITFALQDEEVEQTVDSLMEATTERLVFVNTPESSDSVRFDIRQLQEFFAGEFMYSDITADILHDRMQLVAADAHWREVMHFLLSALIFNNRRLEVSVAVGVLAEIDSNGETDSLRYFQRLMSVGALLSHRLIVEGVLEQDKRFRQQFSRVLSPVFGTVDSLIINDLISIKHPNSFAWIINQAIEHASTITESESMGAYALLAQVDIVNHPRAEELYGIFKRVSKPCLMHVLTACERAHRLYSDSQDTKQWAAAWFVELVFNQTVLVPFCSEIDYTRAVAFLRSHAIQLYSTKSFIELDNDRTKLIFLLLGMEAPQKSGADDDAEENRVVVGPFSFTLYEYSWQRKNCPPWIEFPCTDRSQDYPLISMVYLVKKFAQQVNFDNYVRLANIVLIFGNRANFLPGELQALLPLKKESGAGQGSLIFPPDGEIEAFDIFRQENAYNGVKVSSNYNGLRVHDIQFSSDWDDFFNLFPSVAIDLWAGGFQSTSENQAFLKALLKSVENDPTLISDCILQWGKIFASHDTPADIRKKVTSALHLTGDGRFFSPNIYPFEIDTEREIHLLPLLARSLVDRQYYMEENLFIDGVVAHSADVLTQFGLPLEFLFSIIKDAGQDPELRRSALSCYLSMDHRQRKAGSAEFFQKGLDMVCFELLRSNNKSWFKTSIFMFAERALSYEDSTHVNFVSEVLFFMKVDLGVRGLAENLISNWREISRAPVQSSKTLSTWLTQQEQAL